MKFTLDVNHKATLEKLANSGMPPVVIAQRAKILLLKASGMPATAIAAEVGVSRHTAELWIKKYRTRSEEDSIEKLLNVSKGRGRKEEIIGEAKTWLISVACTQPKDFGYAAETWTTRSLTQHINKTAAEAGFDRLATISESGVYRILDKSKIKPFRIQYYCERRDPEFDDKMHNVLLVYKQLSIQLDEAGSLLPYDDGEAVHVVSYDEKPGLQAIANVTDDRPPAGEHGTIKRDYEYKRLGTVSLLAGIDLQTGEAIPLVRDSHNSADFIDFLKVLDTIYPKGDTIRLVLDNLRVHRAKKVIEYLSSVEGRFEFVFTPKHASWLNLIEAFFSKMTKQMLKNIRVKSKEELIQRIYTYFDEINAEPVIFRWTWHLDDIDPGETVKTETLLEMAD